MKEQVREILGFSKKETGCSGCFIWLVGWPILYPAKEIYRRIILPGDIKKQEAANLQQRKTEFEIEESLLSLISLAEEAEKEGKHVITDFYDTPFFTDFNIATAIDFSKILSPQAPLRSLSVGLSDDYGGRVNYHPRLDLKFKERTFSAFSDEEIPKPYGKTRVNYLRAIKRRTFLSRWESISEKGEKHRPQSYLGNIIESMGYVDEINNLLKQSLPR